MKYYFAPMEGITGHLYRKIFNRHYGEKIDKYFAPFIFADRCKGFKEKDIEELLPENNEGMVMVPQLLTNNAADFIHTAKKIKDLGYDHINLNLGCPVGTVVSKKRGSGLLAYKDDLRDLLEGIFNQQVTAVSLKTRLGKENPEEFYDLMNIYNQYPVEELIIHPRVQTDLYNNKPNLNAFREACRIAKMPVCYNGDLFTAKDVEIFTETFPEIETVMLGRGLLTNGGLLEAVYNENAFNTDKLKAFHDDLYQEYKGVLGDERRVLFRMKELWSHMKSAFSNSEPYIAKIKRAETFEDYEETVKQLFRDEKALY